MTSRPSSPVDFRNFTGNVSLEILSGVSFLSPGYNAMIIFVENWKCPGCLTGIPSGNCPACCIFIGVEAHRSLSRNVNRIIIISHRFPSNWKTNFWNQFVGLKRRNQIRQNLIHRKKRLTDNSLSKIPQNPRSTVSQQRDRPKNPQLRPYLAQTSAR